MNKQKATPDELRNLAEQYHTNGCFRKGDIVAWKPGMKNSDVLDEGEIGIVMYDTPCGSEYYHFHYEVSVGVKDKECIFRVVSLPRCRIQLYEPSESDQNEE